MPTIPVYNQAGEKVRDLELSDAVFGVPVKSAVVASVVEALRANLRRPTAHTKSRGEVRGGGRKPWKQKGTGRARVGSIRSPLWRGGGIIFGPKATRTYTKKVNAKLRHAALVMCLSDKVGSGAFAVVDAIDFSTGKTAAVARLLSAVSRTTTKPFGKKSSLFLLEHENALGRRAVKNLPNVTAVAANELNALKVLHHSYMMATASGIRELESQLSGSAKAQT